MNFFSRGELKTELYGECREDGSLTQLFSTLHSSLLFSEAPTTGEATLISEGLREALSSYISLTDDISLEDAKAQRPKGEPRL